VNVRPFHRRVAQTLAALYLVFAAGPAVALVLCVEPDGRQDIESALAHDCCGAASAADSAYADGRCHCTDTPLLQKATLESKRAHAALRVFQLVLFSVPPSLATLEREGFANSAHTDAVEPNAQALRSVILLI
jgi:hypothetical protein